MDIEIHGVNRKAIEAIKEVVTDISSQSSDLIYINILKNSNLVVTFSSDVDVNCPTSPPHVKKEHWRYEDPAGKPWSEFHRVRDETKIAIENFKSR